ncbi:MAG: ATP-binding protein [Ruminococcaceae bacterium]|nr:ATP-binding protein [Oscillospiraceae bacterium]
MLKNTSIDYTIINIPECINKAIAESGIPSNIKISVQTNDDQLFVLGDKYHLMEVFKNMFINSIQAIKKKQPELPEIDVYIFTEDMFCIIEIKDNGCGIDSKDYKKIFRSFYTSKNYVAGSGIGLTYSRNVIRLHHGDIEVESELGKYSLFRIVLPITNKVRKLI